MNIIRDEVVPVNKMKEDISVHNDKNVLCMFLVINLRHDLVHLVPTVYDYQNVHNLVIFICEVI